jgi:hypothetical protein
MLGAIQPLAILYCIEQQTIGNILGHIEHRARVMSEVGTRRKKQPHREKQTRNGLLRLHLFSNP